MANTLFGVELGDNPVSDNLPVLAAITLDARVPNQLGLATKLAGIIAYHMSADVVLDSKYGRSVVEDPVSPHNIRPLVDNPLFDAKAGGP